MNVVVVFVEVKVSNREVGCGYVVYLVRRVVKIHACILWVVCMLVEE